MKKKNFRLILIITLSLMAFVLTLSLTACSVRPYVSDASKTSAPESQTKPLTNADVDPQGNQEATFPLTISHAFGETVIEAKPQRVATIAWGNHDVPLALGIMPVGISTANYGVTDGSGMLPWTKEAIAQVAKDGQTASGPSPAPVLFNDLTELDYEGIKAANPDVILAAYSGITKEEYALLSEIAPVVAYPGTAWQTTWREQITHNARALGLEVEGNTLVATTEAFIDEQVKAYPQIKGKSAGFFYFNPADLGKFYVYLPTDSRAAFLTDLGFEVPKSIADLAKGSTEFAIEISAETADLLNDLDVVVAYGDPKLLDLLQNDPLLGQVTAIKKGAVALVEDNTPLAAAGTPSPLSIKSTLASFLEILGNAATK